MEVELAVVFLATPNSNSNSSRVFSRNNKVHSAVACLVRSLQEQQLRARAYLVAEEPLERTLPLVSSRSRISLQRVACLVPRWASSLKRSRRTTPSVVDSSGSQQQHRLAPPRRLVSSKVVWGRAHRSSETAPWARLRRRWVDWVPLRLDSRKHH